MEPTIERADYVYAILSLLVCIVITCICIFRTIDSASQRNVLAPVRFAGIGVASIVYGVSPWTGEWSGWPGLLFSASVLIALCTDWKTPHAPAPLKPVETIRNERA
jgi:hypothetical protein